MGQYKQYTNIHIESGVAFMFNQMVKASHLNKSDFLQVLINHFNEHDIRSRTSVDDGSTGEDNEGIGSTKDTGTSHQSYPPVLYTGSSGLREEVVEATEKGEEAC
jgi:hypothetical protein